VLGAYNSYTESKVLGSLVVLQGGSAEPEEIVEVSAYADSDENGFFDPQSDSLLETVTSSDALYTFKDLGMTLEPYKSSLLFLAYRTAVQGIRDSVSVDFQIIDKSFIGFTQAGVNIEGEFPLNSAGIDFTDGMIARQIDRFITPGARVSPGDGDIPCLSVRLPCNGTLPDTLSGILFENLGTAMPGQDIDYFRLWRESGGDASAFDPGLEELVAVLAWDGSYWSSVSALTEHMPCEGLLLHVTADIAATAAHGRTVHLSLPVNGAMVTSGNDGPLDAGIVSPAVILVTTDPLIVSFEPLGPVTRQQTFEVLMRVQNVSDTALTAVVPDSFSWSGGGSLSLQSGPVPPAMDLEAQEDSAFVWTLLAESVGTVVFRGKARETAGTAVSMLEYSDTLVIEEIPDYFTVTLDDLSPVSLNRGREDASLVELIMSYGGVCTGCARVDLVSIGVLFTDGSGSPLPVGHIASRVRLEDESQVLTSVETTGLADSMITLAPDDSVVFSPGEVITFRIAIDVSDTAAAGDFRVQFETANVIALVDHNSGNPVSFAGASFPWSTNVVTIKDPAIELVVGMNATLPAAVNRGQDAVEAFELVLTNAGGASGADISVSEISFRTRDESDDTLAAGDVFRVFRLNDHIGYTYFSTETFGGSSIVRCTFQPELTVSAQVPVSLFGVVDCLAEPVPGGFSIVLEDSVDVAARDLNSGNTVSVRADTAIGQQFPLRTGQALFFDRLSSFSVSGEGLLPVKITAGMQDVMTLRVILAHTGGGGESPASSDRMTVRVLNESGMGIRPNDLFEAIHVISDGSDLGSVYLTAQDTLSDVELLFSEALLLGPGESDTLMIELDISASADRGFFQIHCYESGLEIHDVTDGSSFTDIEGTFPLSSGVAEIVLPADAIYFRADAMLPENVAAGSEAGVFNLHFERDGGSGGSLVFVDRITFDVLGENDNPIDPAALVAAVRMVDGDGDIPALVTYNGGDIQIDFSTPPAVDASGALDMQLYTRIVDQPQAKAFSARIGASADISCTDETTGSPVAVSPEGSTSFPYLSGRSVLLVNDIEAAFSNYPNPFIASREHTTITFYLPDEGRVTLQVYTIDGRLVRTLLDGDPRGAGLHQDVTWNGRNGAGDAVLNGVYYIVNTTVIGGRERVCKRKAAVVW
jgi:hypothetical protein